MIGEDLINTECGSYTVIKKLDFVANNGSVLWLCRCKCGRTKNLTTNCIKSKNRKQCLNCANRKYVGKISGYLFGHIKRSAIRRKIEFNITHEDIWLLYINQNERCKLSNIKIDFADTRQDQKDKLTTASLDRIDSSKGYNIDNIQWIHKDINMMKQRFSQQYFIQMCKNIAENNKC